MIGLLGNCSSPPQLSIPHRTGRLAAGILSTLRPGAIDAREPVVTGGGAHGN
jgi:hypothetical protein